MNRRAFSHASFFLLASSAIPLAACRRSDNFPPFTLDAFSQSQLHSQLEAMRLAFEAKSQHVTDNLAPPLSAQALREQCAWFPAELPEELVSLYAWHGGMKQEAGQTKYPFWFRDCGFVNPAQAQEEYKSIMASYGLNPMDHELLKYSFPFAAFNGGWLILPCKGQSLDSRFPRPVIFVMQGISVFFYSLQLMTDTCLEWVSHPKYEENAQLPQDVELQIWQKHNPGIFSSEH